MRDQTFARHVQCPILGNRGARIKYGFDGEVELQRAVRNFQNEMEIMG